jgi:hypothetical protein
VHFAKWRNDRKRWLQHNLSENSIFKRISAVSDGTRKVVQRGINKKVPGVRQRVQVKQMIKINVKHSNPSSEPDGTDDSRELPVFRANKRRK